MIYIDDFKTDNLTFKQDGSFMGSTNFVSSLWLPDIQIFKCKQFKKRQIVTDVAGPPIATHFPILTAIHKIWF